jgi:hypothetical protein
MVGEIALTEILLQVALFCLLFVLFPSLARDYFIIGLCTTAQATELLHCYVLTSITGYGVHEPGSNFSLRNIT